MKRLYRRAASVLALLAIVVCLTAPQGVAAEKALKKFNVGYLASTGHAMYFIAKEKGYFEQEGLDVQLFLFTNSGEGLNAISSGKLDAGSFGTASPLVFISKGVDLTIFGGQMSEGHGIVAKPEKAEQFKHLKNYVGKTIATVRLSTGDVVFRGGLHSAGVDWKNQVTIKELDSPGAVLEAVKKGSVDAGILWPPFLTLAEQQGLKVALRSGDILPSHTCCRQVALTQKIRANEADYVKFVRALIRAHAFYKAHPDETVDVTGKYVQIDKAILKKDLYNGNLYLSPDPEKSSILSFWNYMNRAEYVISTTRIEPHISTEIFRKALESLIIEHPNEKDFKALKASFKA
jgi:NitT/TauT family transport system substrate-binding protein